jgi:hypothetical protein
MTTENPLETQIEFLKDDIRKLRLAIGAVERIFNALPDAIKKTISQEDLWILQKEQRKTSAKRARLRP